MQFPASFVAAIALTLSACAAPTAEQQLVADAAAALGGEEKIRAARTLLIEGEGTNVNLGHNPHPDANRPQHFKVTGYRRVIDLAAGRSRVEQVRTATFLYPGNQPLPQRQVLGIDGEVGYDVGAGGAVTRIPNPGARDRRLELHRHPLTIVRAALDPAAKLGNQRNQGSESLVDVTTADGLELMLAVDTATKLPTRVVSPTDYPFLGDVEIETTFADYREAGGFMLPTHLTSRLDVHPLAEIRISKNAVDADVGDLTAPAAAASAPPIETPPAAPIGVEQVEKGVWFLSAPRNSVVVEFSDHLVLIEAPLNDAQTLAAIGKARELQPLKPLTHVVNTHHHFDHSGGVRAAVSEGLTIITHRLNQPFYQSLVQRPHTIRPDALANNPRPLKIVPVDSELTLADEMTTVMLYLVEGTVHADTLLMAYLPRGRLLIEADLFNGGASIAPAGPVLLENIKKRKLKVDRILPIHGTVAPFQDLEKAIRATSSVLGAGGDSQSR